MKILGHYRQWTKRERALSTFALCLVIVAAYSVIFSGPEVVAYPEPKEGAQWSEQRVRQVLSRRGTVLSDEWEKGLWKVKFRPTTQPISLEELLEGSPLKSMEYSYQDEVETYHLAFGFPSPKETTYSPREPESEKVEKETSHEKTLVSQQPKVPQKTLPPKTPSKKLAKTKIVKNTPTTSSSKPHVEPTENKVSESMKTELIAPAITPIHHHMEERKKELKLSEMNLSTQYTTLLPAPHVVEENQLTLLVAEAPEGVKREAILDWDTLEEGQSLLLDMDFSIPPEEIFVLSLGSEGTIIETKVDPSMPLLTLTPKEGRLFGVKVNFPKKGVIRWNLSGPAFLVESKKP